MNKVPDLLTLSRGVIAVAIFSLGFVGKQALEAVIVLTMIGWTTDIFDGRLARKYNKPPTWVGEQEFTFDMMMVFSALCYLTMDELHPSGSGARLRDGRRGLHRVLPLEVGDDVVRLPGRRSSARRRDERRAARRHVLRDLDRRRACYSTGHGSGAWFASSSSTPEDGPDSPLF